MIAGNLMDDDGLTAKSLPSKRRVIENRLCILFCLLLDFTGPKHDHRTVKAPGNISFTSAVVIDESFDCGPPSCIVSLRSNYSVFFDCPDEAIHLLVAIKLLQGIK